MIDLFFVISVVKIGRCRGPAALTHELSAWPPLHGAVLRSLWNG